jgi:hypothetical protein
MGYSTYIVGADAFFNQDTLDEYTAWVRFRPLYVSNWRILHIDGFEAGLGPVPGHFLWTNTPGPGNIRVECKWVDDSKVLR